MATVQVTFKQADNEGRPIEKAGFSSNQTITSSGTSQATTAAATNRAIAVIVVTGGNIRYAAAPTPTAAADDTSQLILDGERLHVAVNPGDKIAIIDA